VSSSMDFNGTMNIESEVKVNVDFPFDLNNLFNMSYSFDILKQAIQFMASQQVKVKSDVDDLKKMFSGMGKEEYVTTNTYNQFAMSTN